MPTRGFDMVSEGDAVWSGAATNLPRHSLNEVYAMQNAGKFGARVRRPFFLPSNRRWPAVHMMNRERVFRDNLRAVSWWRSRLPSALTGRRLLPGRYCGPL